MIIKILLLTEINWYNLVENLSGAQEFNAVYIVVKGIHHNKRLKSISL